MVEGKVRVRRARMMEEVAAVRRMLTTEAHGQGVMCVMVC
jgi:hypothetical protein